MDGTRADADDRADVLALIRKPRQEEGLTFMLQAGRELLPEASADGLGGEWIRGARLAI
jgi:hypothetical protein